MSDALNARLDRCSLGTLKLKGRKSERASEPKSAAHKLPLLSWKTERRDNTKGMSALTGKGVCPKEDAVREVV